MAKRIITAILNHDMDFLIHFQRNVIKNCSVEGIDPRMLSAMRDILHILEYDNAAEWRGDLERKPSLYQWLPINGNTL